MLPFMHFVVFADKRRKQVYTHSLYISLADFLLKGSRRYGEGDKRPLRYKSGAELHYNASIMALKVALGRMAWLVFSGSGT